MINKKTTFSALLLISVVLSLNSLEASTQLRLNAAGDLEITDASGRLVKALSNGSISQSIKTDNQAFKVSYGKDLKGRFTTIIYPDPEKPQTVSLSIFKQDVVISSDAVLTVITEKDQSSSILQSGVLGKVSVGGTSLAGGSPVKIQNGSIVAYTPPPVPTKAEMLKEESSSMASMETPTAKQTPPPAGSAPDAYAGARTRKVEGDVMIAPPGQTVVDAIKNSPTPPRLDLNETVTPGSTVQTGPTGKAYVSPFPGAVLMIEPNSTVEFEELAWRNNDGRIERKMTANVKQGSVISAIKGIKPEELDYKIKTPHGVAAARGTVYITRNNGSSTTVVVSQGKVQVVTSKGTFTIGVDAGNKVTITADGPDGPTELKADAEDIRAAEALLAEVESFLSENGGSDGDGDFVAPPTLDALINSFQSTFEPDLTPAPMTPTTSP
jgi:hypothetical protein